VRHRRCRSPRQRCQPPRPDNRRRSCSSNAPQTCRSPRPMR
jgi:hypothetical protein